MKKKAVKKMSGSNKVAKVNVAKKVVSKKQSTQKHQVAAKKTQKKPIAQNKASAVASKKAKATPKSQPKKVLVKAKSKTSVATKKAVAKKIAVKKNAPKKIEASIKKMPQKNMKKISEKPIKKVSPKKDKSSKKEIQNRASKAKAKLVAKKAKPVKKIDKSSVTKTPIKKGKLEKVANTTKPVKETKIEDKKTSVNKKASSNKKESQPNIMQLIDKEEILKDVLGVKHNVADKKKAKQKPKHIRAAASIYSSYEEIIAMLRETNKTAESDQISSNSKANEDVKKVSKNPGLKKALQASKKPVVVASICDILGFNPKEQKMGLMPEKDVPAKWKKYYNMLVDLLQRYKKGVTERSSEVLKRSVKEDSGDLSAYGQHQADIGSESFERDMAFSMLSEDKALVAEIEAAIDRIKNGTFGICEYTGKAIPESRLMSVPYTRYTIDGQKQKEDEIRRLKLGARQESVGEIPTGSISDDDADQ